MLVLGNAAELNTPELARRVADLYLEAPPGIEPARGFPAEVEILARDLEPYLGDFEIRPGFVLSFTSEGNRLMVQATGQSKFAMFASAGDRFFTKAFEAAVTFDKPADSGASQTALWRQGGRDLPLKRITREKLAAESLQSCTGDFYSDELRTLYGLSLRDGQLMLSYPRGELALQPVSHDVFVAAFPLGTIGTGQGESR